MLRLTEEKSVAGAALTSCVSALQTFLAHSGLGRLGVEPENMEAALVSYFDDKFLKTRVRATGPAW